MRPSLMTRLCRLIARLRHPGESRGPIPLPGSRWWDAWVLVVIILGILLMVGSLELALWPGGTLP